MSALQKLVDDWMSEHNLSTRDVAERSGGKISRTKVADVRNGVVPAQGYSDRVLEGLAEGLAVPGHRIPLRQIREAAGANPEPPTEYRVPKKYEGKIRAEYHRILDAAFETAWQIQQAQDKQRDHQGDG